MSLHIKIKKRKNYKTYVVQRHTYVAKRRTKAQYAYNNSGQKKMPYQGGGVLRSWCCLCRLSSGGNACSLFLNLHSVTCPVRVKSAIYSKEGTMLKEEDGKMEVGGSGWHHVREDAF